MRVIAGAAKGHKLETIEGMATRPTTDRIKETLFNILAFDLPQCSFLDLFSGSGAIGIEALSRGAGEAVFVENAADCQAIIRRNLEHTRLAEHALLLQEDVPLALEQLAAQGKKFHIIFMDPPYASGCYRAVLEKIAAHALLHKDGYVVAEHSSKIPFFPPQGMVIFREKKYKTTILTFLRMEEEER